MKSVERKNSYSIQIIFVNVHVDLVRDSTLVFLFILKVSKDHQVMLVLCKVIIKHRKPPPPTTKRYWGTAFRQAPQT